MWRKKKQIFSHHLSSKKVHVHNDISLNVHLVTISTRKVCTSSPVQIWSPESEYFLQRRWTLLHPPNTRSLLVSKRDVVLICPTEAAQQSASDHFGCSGQLPSVSTLKGTLTNMYIVCVFVYYPIGSMFHLWKLRDRYVLGADLRENSAGKL